MKQIENVESNAILIKTELGKKIDQQSTATQEKLKNELTNVAKQIEDIKSNADLVKTGLEKKIEHQATTSQEKVQNQLNPISEKLNEIENRNEPVVAFRATSVKDAKASSTRVNFNPG